MATTEEGLRAALKQAQFIADRSRQNLSTASAEHIVYWTREMEDADREVARLTRELKEIPAPQANS